MRDWSIDAYQTAMQAAKADSITRRRWAGQNEWDAENMRTESTRFTADRDAELRRCCREAGITRYTLIGYMLRTWMAAWQQRDQIQIYPPSGGLSAQLPRSAL